jgi:MFS family permease
MLCGQGLSLLSLGMSRTMPAAMISLVLVGGMAALQLSTCNTYLQTAAPPELRGRVVSIYVWIFQGLAPLGGFTAGWIAQKAGIPVAILGAGGLCLLAGLILAVVWMKRTWSGSRPEART